MTIIIVVHFTTVQQNFMIALIIVNSTIMLSVIWAWEWAKQKAVHIATLHPCILTAIAVKCSGCKVCICTFLFWPSSILFQRFLVLHASLHHLTFLKCSCYMYIAHLNSLAIIASCTLSDRVWAMHGWSFWGRSWSDSGEGEGSPFPHAHSRT